MMWHWNSLWAPAPGDPPAIDDPVLWRAPWSPEQVIALQARTWEAMLGTTHTWWTTLLAAWPLATAWQIPSWTPAAAEGSPEAARTEPLALDKPVPVAPRPAARKRTPARKR